MCACADLYVYVILCVHVYVHVACMFGAWVCVYALFSVYMCARVSVHVCGCALCVCGRNSLWHVRVCAHVRKWSSYVFFCM